MGDGEMMLRRSHRLVLAAVLVLPILGASGQGAFASGSDARNSPSAPPPSGTARDRDANGFGPTLNLGDPKPFAIAANDGASGISTLTTTFSPAGCAGTTDYPHISGSEASVHGRTKCNFIVAVLDVTTTLKRDRWYGEETLAIGTDDNTSTNWVEATPHWVCYGTGTYSYRGYSSHKSIETSGTYSVNTANWQLPGISRFTC